MRVTVTGATGFIGGYLVDSLVDAGHQVNILGRKQRQRVRFFHWDAMQEDPPAEALADVDAVVNLAGEPIAQRWTPAAKQKIRESRIVGTSRIVNALGGISNRPAVLVSASAVGYYGSRGDEVLTESSGSGRGFLPELCQAWEKEADAAEALGIRVVKPRIGVVLGKGGGALGKMLLPFKLGAGGKLGSGRQWMSWIHLQDLAGLILLALSQPLLKGPLNATAPNPVTNADFTQELARALHRPAFMAVPEFALKAIFGEMSSVLLESQRVRPRAAQAAGYEFKYPELSGALAQVLS